ncbi:GumC family protein [Nodosilinea nodulosa]|uniref:GumC family protein n=1 Tax=Nodosilinea nodulosa TaxID=416001 RepID=UPI0002F3E3C1|nr:polysaccharide biosynthesis tyrosine autokinase [Nodosilinea nodulosa]
MGQPPLLHVLLSSLRRHWPVGAATLASTLGASLLYLLLVPPEYASSVRLMVDQKNTSISALGQALSELNSNTPIGVNPLATQAELIMSREVLGPALDSVSHSDGPNPEEVPTIEELQHNLNVKILPATNILEISYRHTDPEFSAQLLRAIAQSSVEENITAIRLEASSVRYFLETKIPQQETLLAQAEEAERQFQEQNGLVDIEAQTKNLIDTLSNLQNEEFSLQADLQDNQEQQRLLQNVTGADTLTQAYQALQTGQSETLQDLTKRLTEVEAEIAAARSRLGDQHPDLLALYDQRDDLQALYAENLQQLGGVPGAPEEAKSQVSQELLNQYLLGRIQQSALVERLGLVQQEKDRLSQVVRVLPEKQQNLAALVRRRTDAEETLRRLQDKLEEARIAEAQLVSNVRIVGSPVPPKDPVSPNAKVVLVLGTVAGLLLASGAIAGLELLDDTVHSPAEVEALLDLPVLGQLPPLPVGLLSPYHLRDFLDEDVFVEPYRRLLNLISQQCSQRRLDGAGRTVVFTSMSPGEGKSATAIYLGAIAAMLSRRSVILDADLRQPSPTRFFGAATRPGFGDLVTQSHDLETAIQPTLLEHLFLLPCGRVKGHPATLSESPRTEDLLETLRDRYAWTFVDTPVVSLSADAVSLSRYADGLVLVVRPGYTRRRELQQAVADLRNSGTSILGVVFNQTYLPEELFSGYPTQAQASVQGFPVESVGYASHLRSTR